MMSKARVLVWRSLTYSEWIRWVRTISVSIVEYCLSSSNWLEWTKLDAMEWYCNLSLIIFSMSFPDVLRRKIRQNILGIRHAKPGYYLFYLIFFFSSFFFSFYFLYLNLGLGLEWYHDNTVTHQSHQIAWSQ